MNRKSRDRRHLPVRAGFNLAILALWLAIAIVALATIIPDLPR